MSCPYFEPGERFESKEWTSPPRLPLGDPYHGTCHAGEARPREPDLETLRELCNFGNARGRCARFPRRATADAVRFMVSSDEGGGIKLHYILELDNAPAEDGELEYSMADDAFFSAHANPLLNRQARAYIASYLRRKIDPQDRARNPHRR